ncbi:unnamed protein product [Lampetra planeri]
MVVAIKERQGSDRSESEAVVLGVSLLLSLLLLPVGDLLRTLRCPSHVKPNTNSDRPGCSVHDLRRERFRLARGARRPGATPIPCGPRLLPPAPPPPKGSQTALRCARRQRETEEIRGTSIAALGKTPLRWLTAQEVEQGRLLWPRCIPAPRLAGTRGGLGVVETPSGARERRSPPAGSTETGGATGIVEIMKLVSLSSRATLAA